MMRAHGPTEVKAGPGSFCFLSPSVSNADSIWMLPAGVACLC